MLTALHLGQWPPPWIPFPIPAGAVHEIPAWIVQLILHGLGR